MDTLEAHRLDRAAAKARALSHAAQITTDTPETRAALVASLQVEACAAQTWIDVSNALATPTDPPPITLAPTPPGTNAP